MDDQLYQQELLDHYRHPRNYGILLDAQITTQTFNPSCGDEISIAMNIDNGRIKAIKFQGKGCVISQAAASLLTQFSLEKSLESLEALDKDAMLGLIGISLGPTRLRCALLSLEALHAGLAMHRAKQ